jgi:subtilase family serine protease
MIKKTLWIVILALLLVAAWIVVQGGPKTAVTSTTTTTITSALPDLVIAKVAVTPHQTKPKTVTVVYQVENQGGKAAGQHGVKLQVIDVKGKVVATKTVDKLDLGASSGQAVFTVKDNGRYTIKAIADYNNQVRESNETNNSRTVAFGIGIKI